MIAFICSSTKSSSRIELPAFCSGCFDRLRVGELGFGRMSTIVGSPAFGPYFAVDLDCVRSFGRGRATSCCSESEEVGNLVTKRLPGVSPSFSSIGLGGLGSHRLGF